MVSVSASVNLPLHHKVQLFSSGTGSPGWSRKKGRKTVVVWWCCCLAGAGRGLGVEIQTQLEAKDVLPNINRTQTAKGDENAVFVPGDLDL